MYGGSASTTPTCTSSPWLSRTRATPPPLIHVTIASRVDCPVPESAGSFHLTEPMCSWPEPPTMWTSVMYTMYFLHLGWTEAIDPSLDYMRKETLDRPVI